MRRMVSALLTSGAVLGSGAAFAVPTLPNGPLFFQYVNAEQVSLSNSIQVPGGGNEGNWGIFQLTSIVSGAALSPTGSDIQGGGTPIFFDQVLPGGQILGIFYGINIVAGGNATGGTMDLYYWQGAPAQNTGNELSNAANLAKRTAENEYTGFTCASGNTANCTFLASLTFESGALVGAPGITVTSPQIPGQADGTSKSYLSVDTSKEGAWTSILDSNYFTLDPCNNPVGTNYADGTPCPATGVPFSVTADQPGGVSYNAAMDVRLDNNFSRNGASAWDGPAGTDIRGLRSNDPGRAFVVEVPVPGTIALLGSALIGLAAVGRRRNN